MRLGKTSIAVMAILAVSTATAGAGAPLYPSFTHRDGPSYTEFSVPGSPRSTSPKAIDGHGVIYGDYVNSDGISRGFIRQPNGSYSTFDVKVHFQHDLYVVAANNKGQILGYLSNDSGTVGFIRKANGAAVTFTVPGAVEGSTKPTGMNANGDVVGSWLPKSSPHTSNGFLRKADGSITTFAASHSRLGIAPLGINDSGVIVGNYAGNGGHILGFIKYAQDPTIHDFSIPKKGWTEFLAINREGAIAGWAGKRIFAVRRSQGGTLSVINVRGKGQGINNEGTIVGPAGVSCFTETKEGIVTMYSQPGITFQACAMNDKGVIVAVTTPTPVVGYIITL